MPTRKINTDGRVWCYAGMAVGGAISVYANIAERFIRHDAATDRWVPVERPEVDGIILSAAAPIILWLMLEVLIRVKGSAWDAWVVRAMTGIVSVVAFLTSYQHLHDLLAARGDSDLTAAIYPLGIDGLLIGSAVVLWQLRSKQDLPAVKAPTAPRTVEAKAEAPKPAHGAPKPAEAPAVTAPAPQPELKPAAVTKPQPKPTQPASDADRNEQIRRYAAAHPKASNDQVGRQFGVSGRTVRRVLSGVRVVNDTDQEEATA